MILEFNEVPRPYIPLGCVRISASPSPFIHGFREKCICVKCSLETVLQLTVGHCHWPGNLNLVD